MARVDSLIWLLMGFAQLLIGKQLLADPTMEVIGALLQGTGGSSVMLGIYFLIFLSRHQKEFNQQYLKSENASLVRNVETGELEIIDDSAIMKKNLWYLVPIIFTAFGAISWLVK
ncbi:MAG: hypothetical protein CXT72_02440 [Methanobacteriota archaeon]|jgi:hypothetical protein|nr:MAG: hypothetical protein CXT72_02440 [Euryarchaeota archaeon]HIK99709.1 hypothetical protein [Candidatus Poseidoniales archaeon]